MSGISKHIVQTTLFGLLIVAEINAQPKWRVYTSPNKSFSVELPWKPINRRRDLTSYMPNSVSPFKGSTVDDWYDLSMYIDESSTHFFLHVYEVAFKRSQEQFDTEVQQMMGAEQCKGCTFSKNEPVDVGGLFGREYIYQRGKASIRILFVNVGNRIYTLSFSTEDQKGVSRGPVDRVFGSFQPAP